MGMCMGTGMGTLAEIAGLKSISPQELKIINFCQVCADKALRQKVFELNSERSWEKVKDTVRAFDTAKDMEEKFTPKKGEKIQHISGSFGAQREERPTGRSSEKFSRERKKEKEGRREGERETGEKVRKRDKNKGVLAMWRSVRPLP